MPWQTNCNPMPATVHLKGQGLQASILQNPDRQYSGRQYSGHKNSGHKNSSRQNASRHRTGIAAEAAAERLLKTRGYHILNKRYRTPAGEIDLIAKRQNLITFVEVKSRPTLGDAAWAISPRQQQRIAGAADYWLQQHPQMVFDDITFDAVLVSTRQNRHHEPRHIVDAFRLP